MSTIVEWYNMILMIDQIFLDGGILLWSKFLFWQRSVGKLHLSVYYHICQTLQLCMAETVKVFWMTCCMLAPLYGMEMRDFKLGIKKVLTYLGFGTDEREI